MPIKLASIPGLSNQTGTTSMDRTSNADSATSQFFINTVDNRFLDYQNPGSPGYAVFGKVIDGMDVVSAIGSTQVSTVTVGGVTYQNFPSPYLISVYSVDRFVTSATQVATTHTLKTNEYGISTASYAGSRLDYGVKINSNQTLTVTKLDGAHTSEVLSEALRLEFADSKFAYDLGGNAGKTALLINAAFGPDYLKPNYLGVVMGLFDRGMSLHSIADLAVPIMHDLAGNGDNATFVRTIYEHLIGTPPDANAQTALQGILDRGEMTQSTMLEIVTNSDINGTAIKIIGMSHSGVGFV